MEIKETNNKNKLNPLQILLIIAGITWLFVLGGTVYNLPDIPKTSREEVRRVISKDTATVADLETNEGKIIPGVKISDIITPNDKLIKMGETAFKSSCASCHGEKGKGDGVAGTMLTPKPRNFHEKTGWKNGREIAGMFKTLQEGIAGSGMSAYEFLPVEERFAIIYFIRSFTNGFPAVTEADLKSIDDIYDITRDKKSGSQIPVKTAEGKIIKEHQIDIDKILSRIENSQTTTLALFNSISKDKRRVILTLAANKEWQGNLQSFIKIVTSDLNTNGFRANVTRLSSGQAAELQVFLKAIIG